MTSVYRYLCGASCCVLFPVILTLCAWYAYQVNAQRPLSDPNKRNYSPYAPWLAPITIPLIVLINVPLFFLGSLLFGVFLVIFPFTLIFFRLQVMIKWISKQAIKIGNWVLKVNTGLLKIAGFPPTAIRLQYEQKHFANENP